MIARNITAALKGRWSGSKGVAHCPAHDDRSPSLAIKGNPDGGVTVHCFAGCDWRDVKAELQRMGLLPEFNGEIAEPLKTGEQRRAEQEAKERELAQKEAWAKSIWNKSQEASNSPVEAYLRGRGINILSPTLRYNPILKHADTGQDFPAMVAAVTKWPSREVTGIHRTYLQTGGRGKANVSKQKMMAGSCSGGAVRLATVGKTLAVSEGIETGLSVQQSSGIPTWAALSTSGIKSLVLPELPLASEIIIAADHDTSGQGKFAAETAAKRWSLEGRDVLIILPPTPGTDFNDTLQAGGFSL